MHSTGTASREGLGGRALEPVRRPANAATGSDPRSATLGCVRRIDGDADHRSEAGDDASENKTAGISAGRFVVSQGRRAPGPDQPRTLLRPANPTASNPAASSITVPGSGTDGPDESVNPRATISYAQGPSPFAQKAFAS